MKREFQDPTLGADVITFPNRTLYAFTPLCQLRLGVIEDHRLHRTVLFAEGASSPSKLNLYAGEVSAVERLKFKRPSQVFISSSKSSIIPQLIKHHERLKLVSVAVAVEQFHLDAGVYPANLNALVPEYLPAMPIDFWSGSPFKYKRGTYHPPVIHSSWAKWTY